MFADYRIPQVFLYFKAFRYSDSLLKKLQVGKTLVAVSLYTAVNPSFHRVPFVCAGGL